MCIIASNHRESAHERPSEKCKQQREKKSRRLVCLLLTFARPTRHGATRRRVICEIFRLTTRNDPMQLQQKKEKKKRKRTLPPSPQLPDRSTILLIPSITPHLREPSSSNRSSPCPPGAISNDLRFEEKRPDTQYHFSTREAQLPESGPSKLTRSGFERLAFRRKTT